MSTRRHVLKTILWAIMGVLAVVTVVRFMRVLGATTAVFVRVRQRALKVAAVIAVGIVGGAAAAASIWGDLGLFKLIVVSVCLLLFLTIPLLLQVLLGRDTQAKNKLTY